MILAFLQNAYTSDEAQARRNEEAHARPQSRSEEMSTKSHWRQAGLLSGLVATLGPVPASPMSTAPGGKKRPSRHYLRRVTYAMLSGAKWSGDPVPRSFVRPWRATEGMTGKAYRRQEKRQRRAARALAEATR